MHRLKSIHSICLIVLLYGSMMFFGCWEMPPKPAEIAKQVSQLETLEAKKLFLEKIITDIEALEIKEKTMRFSGSEEMEMLEKEKSNLSLLNQMKISAYFDQYGYPSRAELGQYAAFAPYAVIYYVEGLDALKDDEFKYFYGAYRFNDIPEELFLSYLQLYYEKQIGARYRLDREVETTDNIEAIMDELGIEY